MTNQYSYAETFAKTKVEAPKKKIAESNISSAAKVYMLSRTQEDGTVSGYRNGNNNGQRYMTGEDFVTYFQRRGRVEAKPENVAKRTVSTSEVYRSRPDESRTTGKIPVNTKPQTKTSYGAPNVSETIKIYKPESNKKITKPEVKTSAVEDDDVKIYVPRSAKTESGSDTVRFNAVNTGTTSSFAKTGTFSKIKKAADEWLPEDEIVKSEKKKKSTRPFSKMILAVAGTAVSLMLIVSGSVLMSGANRDVKSLERELNQLKATENQLELELEMKNDVNVLRTRAIEELGMIRKEYVEASYLNTRGEDEILVHEQPEEENVGFAAILSAFGLAD